MLRVLYFCSIIMMRILEYMINMSGSLEDMFFIFKILVPFGLHLPNSIIFFLGKQKLKLIIFGKFTEESIVTINDDIKKNKQFMENKFMETNADNDIFKCWLIFWYQCISNNFLELIFPTIWKNLVNIFIHLFPEKLHTVVFETNFYFR